MAAIDNHVPDNRRDDNYAADNRPITRTLAEEKKNPNGIKQWFDKTDKIRIERTNSFGDTVSKEKIRDSNLEDS